eukprot:CAMPEP_0184872174 /NCGR_PEP_ID=MMETSP0580-20130426/41133_1 /TAXON_ID=1118495 /ORGANISM="Dactyliosolen fragilissimus" /LENGTH=262 /DNA_ID=CAMNT_0027374925 /DNA_START=460 /DNA_END=1248 /DNA_ORIENTATION=-
MSSQEHDISMTNTVTTIDPNVVQSRILQSSSLASNAMMEDDEMMSMEESQHDHQRQQQQQQQQQQHQPTFAKLSALESRGGKVEYRRIRCPAHRYTPLREDWEQILMPLVQFLKLQVRFNTKNRSIEMKTSPHTLDSGALQKGADFCSAYMLGFEVQDAVALLRLDDLYLESFQVTDVKMLKGDHLSRAVGRVAGQDGKTRFAIENATRTRIVVADTRIHMLGSYANIRVARNAICDLILGAPPGKVYNNMRNVAKRMNERY